MNKPHDSNDRKQHEIDQDRDRIDASEPQECQYWLTALGIDYATLKQVVTEVGPMAKDVRKHLASRKGSR